MNVPSRRHCRGRLLTSRALFFKCKLSKWGMHAWVAAMAGRLVG